MSLPVDAITSNQDAAPWKQAKDGPVLASQGRLGSRMTGACQLLASLILAWFWLRGGLAHVTNSYYFLSSIYSYEIVGPRLGVAAAMALPSLQLTLAAGLVSRRFVGGSLLISALLLTVFASAQVSALARGLEIGCGCFGAAERQVVGGDGLARTSLLLACSLGALLCWLAGERHAFARSKG